jgi:hypothetical protein
MAGDETKPTAIEQQGATPDNLSAGEGLAGVPQAPVISNEPPKKTPTAEEAKAAAEAAKKAQDETAAATAAAGDDPNKPKQEGETEAEVATFKFEKVGDARADAALDLMVEAKMSETDVEAVFGKALLSGNASDINSAELIKKVGPVKAQAILGLATAYANDVVAARQAVLTQAHTVAGGEAQWKQVEAWSKAREAKDPKWAEAIAGYRPLIDKGGVQAELALKAIVESYKGDPDTKGLTNTLLKAGGAASVGAVDGAPLTRNEYHKLITEEQSKLKPNPAVVASLRARRKAGQAAGI